MNPFAPKHLPSRPLALAVYLALAAVPPAQAGDILRGGTSAVPQTNVPTASTGTATAVAAKARANATDALARTTQAMQSVRAMQTAARKLAIAGPNNLGANPNFPGQTLPNVPNGLVIGGLQVAPGVPIKLEAPAPTENPDLWTGAKLPTQTLVGGKTKVTIVQTQSQALLNWQTFNVGKSTSITFDQKAGGNDASKWIAFNKINDPSGNPTQILGSLDAIGQVYLINQNGILFGGSSQVNTHNLTASSLPINENLVARGLLNNPDSEFLFSARVQDSSVDVPTSMTSFSLTASRILQAGTTPIVTLTTGPTTTVMTAAEDYTLGQTPSGQTTVTFTATGLSKVAGKSVGLTYSLPGGDIQVMAGASLSTPTTPEHVGGRILLAGANVFNAGTITTPDGQTILAAGRQVALTSHAKDDPSLRGLDTFVGVVDEGSGKVTSTGLIDSQRASVVLTGKDVAQSGSLNGSTSVSLNGRIDLLADYGAVANSAFATVSSEPQFLFTSSGTVTFGASSLTQILPELSSKETAIGTRLSLPSLVNVRAQSIHLESNSQILAPGAILPSGDDAVRPKDNLGNALTAGIGIDAGKWSYTSVANTSASSFIHQTGQIYLETGTTIDVSGLRDVSLPVARNFLTLQLRGTELADSPVQRTGPFRGKSISLDLRITGSWDPTLNNGLGDYAWVGTPLADARGFRDLIQRSVGELSTSGGTVALKAGDSVVFQQGATIDVSGGSIKYEGGTVSTTRVVADGRLYDISQATPDRIYDGFYTGTYQATFVKYGLSETYTNPLDLNESHYEAGYVEGAAGGAISITAPSMALDGKLTGQTIAGPRQRQTLPTKSTLALTFQAQAPDPTDASGTLFKLYSPAPPDIRFHKGLLAAPEPFALDASQNPVTLSEERKKEVLLSPNLLSETGFGALTIDNSDGGITLPAGIDLFGQAGGRVAFKAATLTIAGKIILPGGSISLTAYNFSPTPLEPVLLTPTLNPSRGQLTLTSAAALNTAGLLVDDGLHAPAPESLPLVLAGGSVSLSSLNMNLMRGSEIDVSGGVAANISGKVTYGNAGKISIIAGVDPTGRPIGYDSSVLTRDALPVETHLDATLVGFSGLQGGELTIEAPLIRIGNTMPAADGVNLSPEYFNQGGFASFTLIGIGHEISGNANVFLPGLVIAPKTSIAPQVSNALFLPSSNTDLLTLSPILLPEEQRSPVSLTFGTQSFVDNGRILLRGDFVLGKRAIINAGNMGKVAIGGSSSANVDTATILGSINAPGGSIAIAGSSDSKLLFPLNPTALNQPLSTVVISPGTILSTAGATQFTFDRFGHRTGTVLNGGTITLSGNLVVEKGALLDVSGSNDDLDFPAAMALDPTLAASRSFQGAEYARLHVKSDAGAIILKGGQELFFAGTLRAAAGGSSSSGGSLTISSGLFSAQTDEGVVITPTLYSPDFAGVTYDSSNLPVPTLDISQRQDLFHFENKQAIGSAVLNKAGMAISGIGHFATDQIVHGGGHIALDTFSNGDFASLALLGNVQTNGKLELAATREITFASGGVIINNPMDQASISLEAPHVVVGAPFQSPLGAKEDAFPFKFSPSYGLGTLTVAADLIDVGNLTLQGIGKAQFVATNGAIRGNGSLNVAGDITLGAGQIYPPTQTRFTIAASDYTIGEQNYQGSVTIRSSGLTSAPLSAGGELDVYGTTIRQLGVLSAPFGTINLGHDGNGVVPFNPTTGEIVAATQSLTLGKSSITSVSGYDPKSNTTIIVPYGSIENGSIWRDPSGVDITTSGPPQKLVTVSSIAIEDKKGALIDIRGGGDLYADGFTIGVGGSKDVLGTNASFAILPNYKTDNAPYDVRYRNDTLEVGDQIFLRASKGLAAGTYTLLPARYALLAGGYLVTPEAGLPVGALTMPDGSNLVSGYRFNTSAGTPPSVASRFEVASNRIVRQRSEYTDYLASTFFELETESPRRPIDAGQLILRATSSLILQGQVAAQGATGGRGGLVDISSQSDIVIANSLSAGKPAEIVLIADDLSRFGAESLLIGGTRHGGMINVTSKNVTLANSGSILRVPDLLLVANEKLILANGSKIVSVGNLDGQLDSFSIGDESITGSGNGALLRVSADRTATISRVGVETSGNASFVVGNRAEILGSGITLDSTNASTLSSTAKLIGKSISLGSGQISFLLDNSATIPETEGLVLSGSALQSLRGAEDLSFLSYSSIDLYGAGTIGSARLATLSLHTGEFRGFDNFGGVARFDADNISVDNSARSIAPGGGFVTGGTLAFTADTLELGANAIRFDQYENVTLSGKHGIVFSGHGSLSTAAVLTLETPVLTGSNGAAMAINARSITVDDTGTSRGNLQTGTGATLTLTADTILQQSEILLPSGVLTLQATIGDLTVNGLLNTSGRKQLFIDRFNYTDGGVVNLISDKGSVVVGQNGLVNVSAAAAGGDAGLVSILAPSGSFSLLGSVTGSAGRAATSGAFRLDTGRLAEGNLESINKHLTGFAESRSIRDRLDSLITISGTTTVRNFSVSADTGSIFVNGKIDGSGPTGGKIDLQANGSLTLLPGSELTVAAEDFNSAGKGGSVYLAAGSETNGEVDSGALLSIASGASINLGVKNQKADSASLGKYTGTLHLRAPQIASGEGLQVAEIGGSITGASKILLEGFRIYSVEGSTGTISANTQANVQADGNRFADNGASILQALYANNASGNALGEITIVTPGAEIINLGGNLTLAADWNLARLRFGDQRAPGVLTLRARDNLVFNGSLSDGFNTAAYNSALLEQPVDPTTNLPLLSANAQSWTYHLSAGADFSAAGYQSVISRSSQPATLGSLQLGVPGQGNTPAGNNARTAQAVAGHFQVIRTGSGDIVISSALDVQLRNPFATIYTAGTLLRTSSLPGGTFDLPVLSSTGTSTNLGSVQQTPSYPVQYSFAGGNVSISAGRDLVHTDDSEKQMPNNWLYRRGAVGPDGKFLVGISGDAMSTTWWVDFSNFFEGIGALGGGDISLVAGDNITNIDAVVPTNARMPGRTTSSINADGNTVLGKPIAPDANSLVEFGGGDLRVEAGASIDGGVYYVEHGQGTLFAGDSIHTNSTRSPAGRSGPVESKNYPESTWLPTTLFLGKGGFDISSRGDILLGPVANAFFLPQGLNNTVFYKSYFSTYGPGTGVNIDSLGGSITLRESATFGSRTTPLPLLLAWVNTVQTYQPSPGTVAYSQPWLRLAEKEGTSISTLPEFATPLSLLPPLMKATSFAGDINLVGNLTFSPSRQGSLEFNAFGSINGLGINGIAPDLLPTAGSSVINLSDTDPAFIPGIASPYSLQQFLGVTKFASRGAAGAALSRTPIALFSFLDLFFDESGSTAGARGSIETKQALHAAGILHAGDNEPVRLYATKGNIADFTFYSSKSARVVAGGDISDVGLYLQNANATDISIVSAGGDITLFDPASPRLQLFLGRTNNELSSRESTQSGDIQIGGMGTLEVLAGGNLSLGAGRTLDDLPDLDIGITTIGNNRNPYLPSDGASLIVASGLGQAGPIANSSLDFPAFINTLTPARLDTYLAELAIPGLTTSAQFLNRNTEEQATIALDIFYRVLRDAGRAHNDPKSAGLGAYTDGFAAIAALFPTASEGDIDLSSRSLVTTNGGSISVLAPGGGLSLGNIILNPPAGIITQRGGGISIFTDQNVDVGVQRIFTLRGGDEIIWSSNGNIAAGASSKTVASAPPTRVLIDPQSGDVQTDLAGLSTGGGIGVLATVVGVPPGDVDLIAPTGTVDAGDAGIQATGNLSIAAVAVLNADNIQVAGTSAGVPTVVAPTINLAGLTAASNTTNATTAAASDVARNNQDQGQNEELPSIILVEVLGYGG